MTEKLYLECKFSADDEAGLIEGIASPFGPPADRQLDVVAPGAFARTLAELKSRGARLPMLVNHDPASPVGAWVELTETTEGLRVRGQIATDTVKGAEAYSLAKIGAYALSIGYATRQADRTAGGGRTLKDVELVEISLVTVPATSRASITNVKGKAMADKQTAPAEDPGGSSVEERVGTLEQSVAGIDKRLMAVEDKVGATKSAVERIEVKLNRPGIVDPKADAKIERKAWDQFLRRGPEAVTERKDLQVSVDTAGGYLAPDQFVSEILKNIVQFSPVRAAARVANTSSQAVVLPKRTAGPTASWVGEGPAARPETQPAYGQNRYPVHEAACYVDVSTAMLEDAAFDVAAELAFDFAEEFGRIEGAAFVTGTGVLQPVGFMTDAGLSYTPSGHASQITADGLIDLYHALPAAYRANAVWGMNSATMSAIRKLKTGTGEYLVTVAGLAGAPATTILGRPVVEMPDMPSINTNTYPIVFGDFSQGYRIFDRVQLAVLRDPYSQATNGLTRFHARRRLAAGVAKAEALRKLKISVS